MTASPAGELPVDEHALPADPAERDLLEAVTIADVADLLAISPYTVRRWALGGQLRDAPPFPATVLELGKWRRWARRDVAGWIEARWPGRLAEARLDGDLRRVPRAQDDQDVQDGRG